MVFISAAALAVIFCLWFCAHQVEQKGKSFRGRRHCRETWFCLRIIDSSCAVYFDRRGKFSLLDVWAFFGRDSMLFILGVNRCRRYRGSFSGDAVAKFGTKVSCHITTEEIFGLIPVQKRYLYCFLRQSVLIPGFDISLSPKLYLRPSWEKLCQKRPILGGATSTSSAV